MNIKSLLAKVGMEQIVWIAIAVFLLLWAAMRPEPGPVNVAVPAAPAREVAKTPKVEAPVAFKSVKAYPKSVKPKLGLPADVQADDNKMVIEASKLPADDRTQTVAVVIDLETGEAETFVRPDPLPWIAFNYTGDAGLYLGLKSGVPTLRLAARQSLLTVKVVHFGVNGTIDQPLWNPQIPAAVFVGGGAWGEW